MRKVAAGLRRRLSRVRILASECEGVLTDGHFFLGEGGAFRRYCRKDWWGIDALRRAGVEVVLFADRPDRPFLDAVRAAGATVAPREGIDRAAFFAELLARSGTSIEGLAYIGALDADAPLVEAVGVALAVADAEERFRAAAAVVLAARGGDGALAEVAGLILEENPAPPRRAGGEA
jgi:3-deoxy-D-manno-octulosonate 8-phosphate phosphatase (KDO 8-P phosphatase)